LYDDHAWKPEDLREDLQEIICESGFSNLVIEATNLSLKLYLINDVIEKNITQDEATNSFYEHENFFNRRLAETVGTLTTLKVLEKLKELNWGPKEYVRDQDVITDAMNQLNTHAVFGLNGFGGVGKTALAHKMISIAATEVSFDRYVPYSSKVGSNQKTVDIFSGSELTDTDNSWSICSTLLGENKELRGSLRRICTRIAKCVHNPDVVSSSSDQDITNMALDVLDDERNRILVFIDNYEDIEDYSAEDYDENQKQELDLELELFNKFFGEWQKRFAANNELKSRILITTRSGLGTIYHTKRVDFLTAGETFDLFQKRLTTRLHEGDKSEGLQKIVSELSRDEIVAEVKNWELIDTTEDGDETTVFGAHPMIILAAAMDVMTPISDFIEIERPQKPYTAIEALRNWRPNGKRAKEVVGYCLQKILHGFTGKNREVLFKLAQISKNQAFNYNNVITQSNTEWAYQEANDFLKTLRNRDFIMRTENGQKWLWKSEIQTMIQRHPDMSNYRIESQDEIEDGTESELEPEINREARMQLRNWLKEPNTDTESKFGEGSKTFKLVNIIEALLAEKYPNEKDAWEIIQLTCTFDKKEQGINNDLIHDDSGLIQTLLEFQKSVSENPHADVGLEHLSRHQRPKSENLRLAEKALPLAWKLLNKSHGDVFMLLSNKKPEETLKFSIGYVLGIAILLSSSLDRIVNVGSNKEILNFHCETLNLIDGMSQEWNNINERDTHCVAFLESFGECLSPMPDEMYESFELDQFHIDLYKDWYDFYHKMTAQTNPNLKQYLFWICIKLGSSIGPDDRLFEKVLNTAEETLPDGINSVKSKWTSSVVNSYVTNLRQSRSIIISEIPELHNRRRFGVINRIVSISLKSNSNWIDDEVSRECSIKIDSTGLMAVVVFPESVEETARKNFHNKKFLCRVKRSVEKIYWVEPLVGGNDYNEPVVSLQKAKNLNHFTKKLKSALLEASEKWKNQIKEIDEVMYWVSEKIGFNAKPYILMGEEFGTKEFVDRVEFLCPGILSYYQTEQTAEDRELIYFGNPSKKERDKFNNWRYERQHPKTCKEIWQFKANKLPSNPKEMAKMFNHFEKLKQDEQEITYAELAKDVAKNVNLFEKDPRLSCAAMCNQFQSNISYARGGKRIMAKGDKRKNLTITWGDFTSKLEGVVTAYCDSVIKHIRNLKERWDVQRDEDVVRTYFEEVKTYLS